MTRPDLQRAVDHAVAAVLRDPRSVADSLTGSVTDPLPRPVTGALARSVTEAVTEPLAPAPTGPATDVPGRAAGADGAHGADRGPGAASPGDLARTVRQRAARWPGILTGMADGTLPAGIPAAAGPGPLAGIAVAVKDNIDLAGLVTAMGGPTGRHRADRDAAAVALLRAAGATVVGHAAMRELAWGVTTPGCPNPWRSGIETGGSSGGSAAAVAAGIVPVALGTDTGGSIRIPAALCGVTGLRPTHGTAPMDGIVAMAPELDTVGPLAATAGECLRVHEILAGPGDPAPESPGGLTVGVLTGWQGRVHPAVQRAVDAAAAALGAAGVRTVPVDLGSAGLMSCVAYVLMLVTSSRRHLADAEQHAGAVDGEVLEQLRQGARIDADPTVYPRARALAAAIRRDVTAALAAQNLAAVLGPVTAVPSVRSGAAQVRVAERTTPVSDALSRYTALASVTGLPALSLPAGLHEDLPVGVQLVGRARGERTLALLAGPIESGPGAAVAAARERLSG